MRKSILLIIGSLMVSGCASVQQHESACVQQPAPQPPAAVATALAFDPAVASPAPLLARDQRDMAAVAGFEDGVAETYDIETNDDQIYYDFPATYERRVLSDRVGVIYH